MRSEIPWVLVVAWSAWALIVFAHALFDHGYESAPLTQVCLNGYLYKVSHQSLVTMYDDTGHQWRCQ